MTEHKIEATSCPECGGLPDDDTGPHEDWCPCNAYARSAADYLMTILGRTKIGAPAMHRANSTY
jgi:hypothetical protein